MTDMLIIPALHGRRMQSIKCAAYCRVSTKQEAQLESLQNQIEHFKAVIGSNAKLEFVKIYEDYGISGVGALNRSGFMAMICDCENGLIDRIYCKSISRFARNIEECLYYLRLLKSLNVSVCFEKDGIDTSSCIGEVMITILGAIADEESKSMSGNIRWGIEKLTSSNDYVPSRLPFGFDRCNGCKVINEKDAAIVQRIFEERQKGHGLRAIAKGLNEENVQAPKGGLWSHCTIKGILMRGSAYGYKDVLKPVQNDKSIIRHNENHYKLYCGICGRKMFAVYKGRDVTLQCGGRYDLTIDCRNKSLHASKLERVFNRVCRNLRKNKSGMIISEIEIEKQKNKAIADFLIEAKEYNNELIHRKNSLTALFFDGLIDIDAICSKSEELDQKITVLNELIKKAQITRANNINELHALLRIINRRNRIVYRDGLTAVYYFGNSLRFEFIGDIKIFTYIRKRKR